VVQDGLRLGAWRETQLAAIQRELESLDLLRDFVECMRVERARTLYTFETARKSQLAEFLAPAVVPIASTGPRFSSTNPWDAFKIFAARGMFMALPRGWIYHNLVFVSSSEQAIINCVDLEETRVETSVVEALKQRITAIEQSRKAHTFLGALAVPNFSKALRNVAGTQSRLHHAWVACALERYRLARGRYPDTLAQLAPEFLDHAPHDLIDAHPLKYRTTSDGGYQIHSVGWDGKDDDGRPER
jgi:hypothetical protein